MKLSFFIALFLASLLCEGTREIAVGSVAAGSMAVGVVSQAGDFPETKTMLTAREITMLDEVNLCRTNPKQYAALLGSYLKELEKGAAIQRIPLVSTTITTKKGVKITHRDTTWIGGGFDKKNIDKKYISAGRECISLLEKTKPLNALKSIECLYNAAKTQGKYCKKINKLSHTGEGGSGPWDRIPKACGLMPNGAENMGGGAETIRIALFNLVVDANVPDRGHRKNLLNPVTKYIGIYDIGIVNGMNNCFIQTFGW